MDEQLKSEYTVPMNIIYKDEEEFNYENKANHYLDQWLNHSSPKLQWRMFWPYLRLVDRVLYLKNRSMFDELNKPMWDSFEKPAHYLKVYLENNPYCCVLYKKYKEYQLDFKSHYDKKANDETAMCNYQCFLSTLLVLLVRLTFLEFEKRVITSMIINLELGFQSVHLFCKSEHAENGLEEKQEYWHTDWNLIQSMISLIIDSRSYNPMMQLEKIAKHQIKLVDPNQSDDEDYRIMAMEFDFQDYHLALWQSNNTMMRWSWIDWHFKNVQWMLPMF